MKHRVTCTVCGKLVDKRGIRGHLLTHPQETLETMVKVREGKPPSIDIETWKDGYEHGYSRGWGNGKKTA